MAFFDGKFERDRQAQMTPERILEIARRADDHSFIVSLRWRDDWLHRRCDALRREGKLIGGKRDGRSRVFYLAAHLRSGAAQ